MREFWSTSAGGWVQHREIFDSELAPFGDALMEQLAPGPGTRLLDIGCGTGTLLELAARRGATGLGVDISPAMIESSRSAEPLSNSAPSDAAAEAARAGGASCDSRLVSASPKLTAALTFVPPLLGEAR